MPPFVRACDSTRIERILGAAAYLTSAHRDNPGAGCVLAALGPDVSRQGRPVRRAVTDYVRSVVDLLVKSWFRAHRRQQCRRRKSWRLAWRLSKADAGKHDPVWR
jgi:hypothetical protein